MATGGQGNDTGQVAIWDMVPIRSIDEEQNKQSPNLLCALDSHLLCVNAVRWSSSGFYLASAGEEQLVMVHASMGQPSGNDSYELVTTLYGHFDSILDLSWSYGDQWLASSSSDNMIIIWNAHQWPETVTTLRGHSGLVKGLAFDPTGKYLASQSDDMSLQVWRVGDWTQEVVISEPFEQCGGTTHVLRLSWSPDGQFLVSAQAMNNCGSVAKIIDRPGWRADKDFVDHRKAIPVMCFDSNNFKFQSAAEASKASKERDKDNKESKQTKLKRQGVIAVNSRDQSISICATACSGRPLMVCKDLFENSIIDFSWSRNGYQLMACSSDGTVTFIEFTEKELHSKVFGNSKSTIMSNLIEDVDMALLRKKQQSAVEELFATGFMPVAEDLTSTSKKLSPVEMLGNNNSNSSKGAIGGGLRLAKGPLNKQIENRSADSRRRIIPLFIPLVSDALVNQEMDHCGGGGSEDASGSTSAAAGTLNPMVFQLNKRGEE